jgi:hypothetical protein
MQLKQVFSKSELKRFFMLEKYITNFVLMMWFVAAVISLASIYI